MCPSWAALRATGVGGGVSTSGRQAGEVSLANRREALRLIGMSDEKKKTGKEKRPIRTFGVTTLVPGWQPKEIQ